MGQNIMLASKLTGVEIQLQEAGVPGEGEAFLTSTDEKGEEEGN